MTDNTYIDVVFDGPPSNETGRFVEVENPQGASISVGEWLQREDGYWVLRLTPYGITAIPCTVCDARPSFYGIGALGAHVREAHPGYQVGRSSMIGGW